MEKQGLTDAYPHLLVETWRPHLTKSNAHIALIWCDSSELWERY
ncbi:unnamed protein product [Gulo gulo]|uniref:Uncharacterized protein n=1 Tax=Gulo gulo TaxID=48420 RepID=A0A9X9M2P3_GULGU|nr:unnamed protein product [Gulo gulo]